jgi:hypothetical protein
MIGYGGLVKSNAPLVGCYKFDGLSENQYLKISENNERYNILTMPNPYNEGVDIKYRLYKGNINIYNALVKKFPNETKKSIKKFAELGDLILLGEDSKKTKIIFFQMTQKENLPEDNRFLLMIDEINHMARKVECSE